MRTETWQPEDILRRALKRAGIITGCTHVWSRDLPLHDFMASEVNRLRFGLDAFAPRPSTPGRFAAGMRFGSRLPRLSSSWPRLYPARASARRA